MRGKHLVLALILVACVRGSSGPPVASIDVARAAAGGPLGDVPAAKGTCIVRGTNTLDVKVRAGDETLDLRIVDLPTESEIDREGNAFVHVRSDLEFDARVVLAKATDESEPSLHVTRDLTLLGGLVKVGKDTEILKPRRVDDAASGIVLIGGYEIEDLPVPCDALVIDERSTGWSMQLTADENDESDEAHELSWVGPHGDILTVCSSPKAAPPCVRTKEMTFEEVGRNGSAVEVRARFDDGSEIRGWAPAEHVTKADEPRRGGYGASGGCGCGRRMLSHLRIGKPDPREHYGKATLRAGSTIYAVPELKGAWATAKRDIEIDIEMHGGDDHARVRELPGVSTTTGCTCPGMDDHAWVKREAVVPIR
jgi:hypothetical protein